MRLTAGSAAGLRLPGGEDLYADLLLLAAAGACAVPVRSVLGIPGEAVHTPFAEHHAGQILAIGSVLSLLSPNSFRSLLRLGSGLFNRYHKRQYIILVYIT